MKPLEKTTAFVISYCEIPQEITEHHWIQEYKCDCYVPMTISEKDDDPETGDEVNNWIVENYPELKGSRVLIEMDY